MSINRIRVYNKLNPTTQTKSKMEKELNEYVLNENIQSNKKEDHRKLYQMYHPDVILGVDDIIHHINGNHYDNRKENLQKVTNKMHRKIHWDMCKEERVEYEKQTKGSTEI